MKEIIKTAPEMNLMPQDLNNLLEQVTEYQAVYHPLLQRREQREKSTRYLHGLLSPEVDNKAIEPMMLKLEGDNQNEIRAMQHFISEGAWKDEPVLEQHWQEVNKDLGDGDGVFIVDGSDFAKQGKESVGVKRQWCGELGKTANCQAGVFLGYVSQKGYALLHRRLYLPKEWVNDEAYAERRQKCGVPEKIIFQTKPTLAIEMLKAVHQAGTLPGRWLTCDEAFGRSPAFLDQVADLGLWYYAEVPLNTYLWCDRPATYVPTWSGRGRKPTCEKLVAGTPDPQRVDSIAAEQWSRHTIKEGSKGPIIADFAIQRMVAVRNHLPGPDVWLIFRRNLSTGELKVYLCNAPLETPHATLIRLSGMRWPIETGFEDSKQLVGMGDYQVRSWVGWHHHMTMCILAHFFLVRLRLRLGDKAPALTLPQVKFLLTGLLPKREFDREWVLEVLGYHQRRNHAAHRSHRKRRLDELNLSEQ